MLLISHSLSWQSTSTTDITDTYYLAYTIVIIIYHIGIYIIIYLFLPLYL